MTSLDMSIVTVALPSIGHSLSASPASLQWVVSGYALAYGLVPILAGRLGDDIGRRRMLLLSSAAFVVLSAVVGFSNTPLAIDLARIAQGLAAGMINPQISGIVQQLFAPDERGSAFSAVGVMTSVSIAAGPPMAGGILTLLGPELGWRALFFINVPVGIVSVSACYRLLPHIPTRSRRGRLDLFGVGLLALSLLGLLFGAVQYDAGQDARLFLLFVPAVAAGAGFVGWERRMAARGGHPLIDLDLLRVRSFTNGLYIGALFFAAFGAAPLLLALYVQDGLGLSAGRSGLIAAAYAVGSVASAPVGGRLVRRYGRRVSVVGLSVFGTGIVTLAALAAAYSNEPSVGLLLPLPLVIAGLGGGGVSNPNQALTLVDVDVAHGSTAGGILQTSQRVGSALGVASVTAVFYALTAHMSGDRAVAYGRAYALGIGCAALFVAGALAIAVRDLREAGPDQLARHMLRPTRFAQALPPQEHRSVDADD
jgi:MFS family permease